MEGFRITFTSDASQESQIWALRLLFWNIYVNFSISCYLLILLHTKRRGKEKAKKSMREWQGKARMMASGFNKQNTTSCPLFLPHSIMPQICRKITNKKPWYKWGVWVCHEAAFYIWPIQCNLRPWICINREERLRPSLGSRGPGDITVVLLLFQ